MPETRWLDDREHAAWRAFRAIGDPLTAVLNRQLTRDSGLSVADYQVLVVLSEAPEVRLRARELGRLTSWEKSRLSHHITRMTARGLVTRAECETDGRGAFIVMTSAGQAALAAAAPGHVETVRGYFIDLLTPEQLEALVAIGAAVTARLELACPELEVAAGY